VRARRTGTAASFALLVAIAALVALQVTQSGGQSTPQPWPLPPPGSQPRVQLGVTTLALARNSAQPWQPGDLTEVNSFEQAARHHSDIVMWFADWAHVANFDSTQAAAIAARGSIPEISWEPWDSTGQLGAPQPKFQLADIIDGSHDAYIQRWAREIAAYKQPVMLRFAQEMNGRSYPWSEAINGNSPGQYVAAWRHVHDIFTRAGATNVRWVWAPVVGPIQASQYPGANYVDVVGLSGFIADKSVFGSPWRPFATAFGPSLDAIHKLAPDEPVSLAEIGVAQKGGDKATWITQMFQEIQGRPYIKSIVWFNLKKEADWRIQSSSAAQSAFAAGINLVEQ
jgi:beta-mannanase